MGARSLLGLVGLGLVLTAPGGGLTALGHSQVGGTSASVDIGILVTCAIGHS